MYSLPSTRTASDSLRPLQFRHNLLNQKLTDLIRRDLWTCSLLVGVCVGERTPPAARLSPLFAYPQFEFAQD